MTKKKQSYRLKLEDAATILSEIYDEINADEIDGDDEPKVAALVGLAKTILTVDGIHGRAMKDVEALAGAISLLQALADESKLPRVGPVEMRMYVSLAVMADEIESCY